MNRFITLTSLLLILSTNALASGPGNIPTPFTPGEVVSADRLNEFFGSIKPELAKTLVGTWKTKCWDSLSQPEKPGQGVLRIQSLEDVDYDGVSCLARGGSDNSLNYKDGNVIQKLYPIGNKALVSTVTTEINDIVKNNVRYVLELSPNQIIITTNNPLSTLNQQDGIEILERINTTPANASDLVATVNGGQVNLKWKDNSLDEQGFTLLRRDSLKGSFSPISQTASNQTSLTDSPGPGIYWYRVQSFNEYGASLGSNLFKIEVSN